LLEWRTFRPGSLYNIFQPTFSSIFFPLGVASFAALGQGVPGFSAHPSRQPDGIYIGIGYSFILYQSYSIQPTVSFFDFLGQASHLSQPWAKEYRASARILPASPIDYDFNLLHADWHPRHYEYLTPMAEETASAFL